MKNGNQKELYSILQQCVAECRACTESCEKMGNMMECEKLCKECAEKCNNLSMQSSPSDELFQDCIDVCNRCAAECAKHDNPHCKKCAEICHKCAEACHQAV